MKTKILIIALLAGLAFSLLSPSIVVTNSGLMPTINIGFADAAYASYIALDFVVSGADHHDVQVQNALDSLPADYGGTIYIWWGDYHFNSQVSRAIDNVIIQGVGAATYIEMDGSTPVFSAGSQSNWLFKNISVDAGGVTDDDGLSDDSDNNYRIQMWIDGVWTHDIGAPGGGGGGNCTEAIRTVTADTGSYSATDCSGQIAIVTGADLTSAIVAGTLTLTADNTLTRDIEWDTIGEIEAATSVNIIINTEVDSESELEALVADVSDFFTDNDSIPEANLDFDNAPVDEYYASWEADTGKMHWQQVVGGGGGNCSAAIISFGGDSGSDYTSGDCSGAIAVLGGTNVLTSSDGAGNVTVSLDSNVTLDIEWDSIGEIETATGVNIIISSEIDSEAELESLLADVANLITEAEINSEAKIEAIIGDNLLVDGELDSISELEALIADVTNIWTDLDGSLDDDDLSDNNASDLLDVAYSQDLGDILYSNSTHWIDLAIGTIGQVLKVSSGGIPEWSTETAGISSVFGIIHPDAGTDPIAQGNDTLNFTSVDFVITGENSTDTVTFALDTAAVNDINVDWGSGPGQIDTDDIPEGVSNLYQLTQEEVEDYIGGLINDGNSTQTRITVTYQDATDSLDFVVDDLDTDTHLTQEEVDDYVAALINDADSVHTRITITYDDADDAYDFIVDAVSLGDIQAACSNDFHNIGGTDDDNPEALNDVGDISVTNNLGDMIYGNGTYWIDLAIGAANTVLASNGSIPGWSTITAAMIAADLINDTMIDWGSGANQVDTDDIPEGSVNKFECTIGGNYTSLVGEAITHDPVLRMMPEIFACSMTGNSSTSWGGCEVIDFGGVELSVVELIAGDCSANYHLKLPADFGYGGNTTLTVSYGIRTIGGSSGSSLIMSTKVGTSISDYLSEDWHNSAAMAWTANNDIYWTADLVIDESLSPGSQDLYIGVSILSEDYDGIPYIDKATFEGWGI